MIYLNHCSGRLLYRKEISLTLQSYRVKRDENSRTGSICQRCQRVSQIHFPSASDSDHVFAFGLMNHGSIPI